MTSPNRPDGITLLEIYRRAKLIMQNDARIRAAMRSGKIVTPYYSPRGQEIVASAMAVNLKLTDYVVTTYRGMHDQVAKGVPLKELWAEYAGRVTGTCKGKGGPMHITHPASGVMVTTGIVGSGMPIANGLGLASQLLEDGRVTVVNFGDGASNIGAFHEALNMAALWKLPVVFLCQNNRYAEKSSYSLGTSVPQVSMRAAAYGMPGITVDGNDPEAMWKASNAAVERARAGEGPSLIEAITFRFLGHTIGDDNSYMKAGELDAAMAKDPVPLLRARLLADGFAKEGELAEMEGKIERSIEDAQEFAMNSPFADTIELRRDVFGEEVAA
jgi:acetoin:2,6-dichlorophenolindophenol oxidoreductase subunit alpha